MKAGKARGTFATASDVSDEDEAAAGDHDFSLGGEHLPPILEEGNLGGRGGLCCFLMTTQKRG